jgi:hypothetical protein
MLTYTNVYLNFKHKLQNKNLPCKHTLLPMQYFSFPFRETLQIAANATMPPVIPMGSFS